MPKTEKTFVGELISDLKQQRDHLRLKIHLGGEELKEEFEKLDDRLFQLNRRFDPLKDLGFAEIGRQRDQGRLRANPEIASITTVFDTFMTGYLRWYFELVRIMMCVSKNEPLTAFASRMI